MPVWYISLNISHLYKYLSVYCGKVKKHAESSTIWLFCDVLQWSIWKKKFLNDNYFGAIFEVEVLIKF